MRGVRPNYTVDCFAELADELLYALGAQLRIAAFGPLLPALFAGPLEMTTAYAVMTLHQVSPQACSFATGGRKRTPF